MEEWKQAAERVEFEHIYREIQLIKRNFSNILQSCMDLEIANNSPEFIAFKKESDRYSYRFMDNEYFMYLNITIQKDEDWRRVKPIGIVEIWTKMGIENKPRKVFQFTIPPDGLVPEIGSGDFRRNKYYEEILGYILGNTLIDMVDS